MVIDHQQEPGATAAEIFNGIEQVRPGGGYVPQFRLFKKVEVNGSGTHPLFAFLKVRLAIADGVGKSSFPTKFHAT